MDTTVNWRDIPMPPRLTSRPKDSRGYPIPASVMIDEAGVPDFRVTDIAKWVALAQTRRCALCGEPLGRHIAFVGGPLARKNRFFTDLGMHRDCAEYALKVCPYLAAPNFRYAESLRPGPGVMVSVAPEVSPTRPEKFFMGITRDFAIVRGPSDTAMVHVSPWEQETWWKRGMQVLD